MGEMNTCATPSGCWGTPSSMCTRQGLLCQLQKATADPSKQPWVTCDFVPLERRSDVPLPMCAPSNFWKQGSQRAAMLQAQANALAREGFADTDTDDHAREGFDCDQGRCTDPTPPGPTSTGDGLRTVSGLAIAVAVVFLVGVLAVVIAVCCILCGDHRPRRPSASTAGAGPFVVPTHTPAGYGYAVLAP